MFDDADAAIAKVQDDMRRARRRAERMGDLQRATTAARGTAISRGRELAVQVDHSGWLTELRLTDAAMRRGPAGVARLILDTARLARRDLEQKLLAAASDILGEDDPALDGLRAQLEGTDR